MATSAERLRKFSKDLPPDLSELMNKLIKHAVSFITEFDKKEQKMRAIEREFEKIADEVKEMQEKTDKARTGGAITAGIGLGLGILAAPFTGGLSLAAAAAAGGAATVVAVNVTKTLIQNGSAKKVEELGREFMKIAEPLKKELKEIKTTCEELEQKSTEVQSKHLLSGVEEFQRILRRVSDLRERSGETLTVAEVVLAFIGELLLILVRIFRVTASPEEDKKLIDSMLQAAGQCQRVTDEFLKMKNELKTFTEKK